MSSLHDRGLNALKSGRIKDAIHDLLNALVDDPDNFELRLLLGIAYGEDGNYDSAVDVLESALRLKPDHAPAHYGLGMAHEGAKEFEAAVVSYRQALRLDPEYEPALEGLKRLRPDEAESFTRAREADVNHEGFSWEASEPIFEAQGRGSATYPPPPQAHPDPPSEPVSPPEISMEWGKSALASPFKRWAAQVADGYCLGVFSTLAGFLGGASLPFVGFLLEIAYEAFAIHQFGATWGMYWMDIGVDSVDGTDVSRSQSLTRAWVKAAFHLLQNVLFYIGLTKFHSPLLHNLTLVTVMFPSFPSISELWIFFNPNRQAIHDLLAGVVVTGG